MKREELLRLEWVPVHCEHCGFAYVVLDQVDVPEECPNACCPSQPNNDGAEWSFGSFEEIALCSECKAKGARLLGYKKEERPNGGEPIEERIDLVCGRCRGSGLVWIGADA